MKPFFFNWDYRDLRRLVFATLATLLCVMYMLGTLPSPRVPASVSDAAQSVATYGVQGIIPWSKWEGQSKGSDGAAWWTYDYDANGNLTTGTQTNGKETFARYQYTWDVKNRLSRFVENETQRQRNGYEFESGLRYLKEDIRFTKQAPMFETVTQRSLYSEAGEQLLAEEDTYSDHKITRGFVYFGNQRVAVVDTSTPLSDRSVAQSATNEGTRGSSPGPSIFPEGKDRWTSYVRDHQGTLLMSITEYEAPATEWGMTDPRYLDSAGKSRLETTAKLGANQYYLYPYGAMYHKGFLYSQLQGTEYTGKTLDEGTQWYYFHARHYDSAYGRFIGHDLVAPDMSNPLTLNPFLYCLNNPGRWVDPDGRWIESGWDAFSLGVGIYSFKGNIKAGNYLAAGIDAVGIAFDSGALIAPVIPGGAGASIKALRAADQVAALPAPKIAGLLEAPKYIPNAGGAIRSFTTEADQTFYRVFSGQRKTGEFLTAIPPKNSLYAQKGLSLPPSNKAEFLQEVFVPKGTLLQRSRALPIPEWGGTGGLEQFQLLQKIPEWNFGEGFLF